MIHRLLWLLMISGWVGVAHAGDGLHGVVFLTVPGISTEAAEREGKVVRELALALRDHSVEQQEASVSLPVLSSSAQIDALRPLFTEGVAAVVWLDPSPDPLRLHLGFAGAGRGVIRVLEQPAVEGFAAALALAAREVLATPSNTSAPTPPPSEAAPVAEPPGPDASLRVAGGVSTSLDGALGPSPTGGVDVVLEVRPVGRLRAGVGFVFRSGGTTEPATGLTEVGGSARLSFLPGSSVVGAGPVVGAELAWVRLASAGADRVVRSTSLPMIRVTPGAELRVDSPGGPGLSVVVAAELMPLRGRVYRRSDEVLIHDSGRAGLSVRVGIRIPLKSPAENSL